MGVSSVANYQAALRSVTFSSTSDNPDNFGASTTRAIGWMVDDGQTFNHLSNTANSTVTVTAVDDPATVHNDNFAASEQIAIGPLLNVFANNGLGADSDVDGPALHVTAVNGVAAGVGQQVTLASGALLTMNANGTFSYDPNGAFAALAAPGSGSSDTSATDTFNYTVNGAVETATVTVTGVDSNDTLHGTAANNSFDGGSGSDTLVFTGNHADYAITYNPATQAYTVVDQRGGSPDGTDTVRNVESFKFADGTISVATIVQAVNNPDGSAVVTTYDAGNDTPWASQIAATDTQGSLASQSVVTDGGTRWVNGFDTTGTQTWTTTVSSFDAANHQLTQLVNNDDGTHVLTLNDVANTYRWATATVSYDVNWNVTGVTGTNDDSSHTITMKDLQAGLDAALWSPSPYDPNQGLPNAVTLTGGGNADYLAGGAGNDTLSGAGGNDILAGNTGNDTLAGGTGNDRFVFHNGDGLDVITDFTAGDAGGDLIELHAYGIANFAALAPFMSQSGADVVIALDPDNIITLQHVTLTQLNAGDFAFG
jgi:Ca2+-binding RTX toxin-like protein